MLNIHQILLDKLDNIFKRAMEANGRKMFFLCVFEYMEVYDSSDTLTPLADSINELKKKDTAELEELEKKTIGEMAEAHKYVSEYVTKEGVDEPFVDHFIDSFEALEQGRLTTSLGPVRSRYDFLINILTDLALDKNKNHVDFLDRYAAPPKSGSGIHWTFSPTYDQWLNESSKLDRIKLTKVWFSWDKLVFFFLLFRDYESMSKSYLEDNKFWESSGLTGYFKEVKSILEGKETDDRPTLNEFKWEEYKTYLQRVHEYTGVRLALAAEELVTMAAELNWTYDRGNFSINDKPAKFQENSFRAKILQLLSKNDKNKRKSWSWDEVFEDVEEAGLVGQKIGKGERRRVYEAAKGANGYIAEKTGVTDFLIFDTKSVRINPKYLS